MSANFRPLLAAALLTAALTACDDPYALEAQFEVRSDTFFVYSINEAPIGAPSAISLNGASTGQPAVTASSNFSFDIAVDVTPDGRVMLIPNSEVGNPLVSPHPVGLQVVDESFANLERAPSSGYEFDSVFVVTPGQTIAIQAADPAVCFGSFYGGTYLYGKFVVDSVKTNPERVFFRSTVDPNCDFRSFKPGIPED